MIGAFALPVFVGASSSASPASSPAPSGSGNDASTPSVLQAPVRTRSVYQQAGTPQPTATDTSSAAPGGFDQLASLFAAAFVGGSGANPDGSQPLAVVPIAPQGAGSSSGVSVVGVLVLAAIGGGVWWWTHRHKAGNHE